MSWGGAVDHEELGRPSRRSIDALDRLGEWRPVREPPVGLDRERRDDRHTGAGRCLHDADRLLGVGQRERSDALGTRAPSTPICQR